MAAKKTSTKKKPAVKTTTPQTPSKPSLKGHAKLLSSKTVYKGKVFWVTKDQVIEPGNVHAERDMVRHNGSVVMLAVDAKTNPADPDILLIRQYRHAAGRFLLELPAGRIELGEKLIPAAKRELLEETGYKAKKWSRLVTYWATPGFVTESMTILLAEDLTLGAAQPEEDERIEVKMTPLSVAVQMALHGELHDGKCLIGVLLYHAMLSSAGSR